MRFAISCVALPVLGVYYGAQEAKKQAEEDAKIQRPVYTGVITKEAQIPASLSERARQEFPYWVLVETEQGLLKINFDTDDPFYDSDKPEETKGMQIYISGRAGEKYRNKAIDMDTLLEVGDRIQFKTREQTGMVRDAYEIVKIEKKR